MKWITRERVKVDRVACPWLIRTFIDAQAEFLFVPEDKVMEVAEREGATPYDVKGSTLAGQFGVAFTASLGNPRGGAESRLSNRKTA
jgi:hypothetical protein